MRHPDIWFAIEMQRFTRGRRRLRRSASRRSTRLPRSPWQNAYTERLIGSIRPQCLDHIIIANERGLRRALAAYLECYQKSRTHLSLRKDAPVSRPVATAADGTIVAIPQLGG